MLAAGFGGWYCYEKFYSRSESSFATAENDARIADIYAIGRELFPGDESGRKRWIKDQISALRLIDSSCADLDANAKSAIFRNAANIFPRDYCKRLSYIQKQEVFARDFAVKLGSSGVAPEEAAALGKALTAEFGGDYELQCARMDDIISCIDRMESVKRQLDPKDFKKISARVMENLARDPQGTERFLYSQFLARHNYLSKNIPIQLGDLKKGIEESFPDDFVAQEKELNLRLESALNRRDVLRVSAEEESKSAQQTIMERCREAFLRYVSKCGKTGYAGVFTRMNGKTVYLFPFEAIGELDGQTFDAGGKTFNLNNVFVSENSSFCIAMAEDDGPEPLEFQAAPEDGQKNCMVAYFGSNGALNVVAASMSGWNLVLDKDVMEEKDMRYTALNGGLVLDAETARPLAVLEVYGNTARNYYERYLPDEGLEGPLLDAFANDAMPSSVGVFEKNIGIVRVDNFVGFRAIAPSSIEKGKWKAFSPKKYALQSKSLSRGSSIIWDVQKFMFDNTFRSALSSRIFARVARKYERIFYRGPKLDKRLFYHEYAGYIREIILTCRAEWTSSGMSQYNDFYDPYKDVATKQNALWNDILLCLDAAMKNAYVHRDLFLNIMGDSYNPSERRVMPSSGGGGRGTGGTRIHWRRGQSR